MRVQDLENQRSPRSHTNGKRRHDGKSILSMMEEDVTRVLAWVRSGKQVGSRFEFLLSGERGWGSVGIQAWGPRYKVSVDEILIPRPLVRR